jgi:hypothetical protein
MLAIFAKNRKSVVFIGLLLMLCGINGISHAQDDADNRTFVGGLIFGGNFTQVDGDNYAGYHKAGINAGGVVFMNLGEHIAPSMEILYTQKGARSKEPMPSSKQTFIIQDYKVNLNYAEVPILLNYFDRRKSHFGAGFSYGQVVGKKEDATTSNPKYDDTVDFENYPFKKSDVNFVLSGSLHFGGGFFLNLRFQYSLFSVRKRYNPEFGRAEQFNNIMAVRLMYLF